MQQTFDYEFINTYEGHRSPTGTVENDLTTWYFFRSLYQRACSIVDFTLPDGWNKNYFKNVLFANGYIGVVDTAKFGVIPQLCTVSGYGLYLQPTDVLVAQPLVQFQGKRGENCEIIRLTPDWRGICDIVEHYAIMLSKLHTSINVSLINSRLGLVAAAKNKAGAEVLKVVAEKLSSGDPLVVIDKLIKEDIGEDESIFTQAFDAARNYITGDLLRDYKTIMSEFDREIGIPVIDDKRERRIESEIDTMTADYCARSDTWKVALTESIADVKKVFPDLEISFKFKTDEKGGGENESRVENDFNRSIPISFRPI